jgi:hypothetical protein
MVKSSIRNAVYLNTRNDMLLFAFANSVEHGLNMEEKDVYLISEVPVLPSGYGCSSGQHHRTN